MGIFERLGELGYELPQVSAPIGAYIPAIRIGNLVMTSGMLPMKDGKLLYKGEIGGVLNKTQDGYAAAKICVLNGLAAINQVVPLDNIERIVKVTGYVNSATSFEEQPKVINGASDFLVEIFGEAGKHVRAAVGVSELPLGASVEVEFTVQVRD
jgi:enamine deaminase RidA (YjgF/YER057c/UK114 family)